MNNYTQEADDHDDILNIVLAQRQQLPRSEEFNNVLVISNRTFDILNPLTANDVKKFLFNVKESLLTGNYKNINYPFLLDNIDFPLQHDEYLTLTDISKNVLDRFAKMNFLSSDDSLAENLLEIPPSALSDVYWYKELSSILDDQSYNLVEQWSHFLKVCTHISEVPDTFTFDDFFQQLLKNKILLDQIGDIGNVCISYFIINSLRTFEITERKHLQIVAPSTMLRHTNKKFVCRLTKSLIRTLCQGRFNTESLDWTVLYELGHVIPDNLDFIQRTSTTTKTAKVLVVVRMFNIIHQLISKSTCNLLQFKHIYTVILNELQNITNLITDDLNIDEVQLFPQITRSMCNLTKLSAYILKLPKLSNVTNDIKRKYFDDKNDSEPKVARN